MGAPSEQGVPTPPARHGIADTILAVGYVPGGYMPIMADVLLPSQVKDRTAATPERLLMLAVLEDALATLERTAICATPIGKTSAAAIRQETIAWFQSEDSSRLYAFRSICEHLGLDVGAVHAALDACDWAPRLTGHRLVSSGRHIVLR